jgi:hypothetical protein
MHPMFVKLFPETGAVDLLADEEQKWRRANRARRNRSRLAMRVSAARPGSPTATVTPPVAPPESW